MEPKTKYQKKIVELSAKLNPINEDQKQWAFDKCLSRYAVRSRNTLFCLECGYSWKDKSLLSTSLLGCNCPNCGASLTIATTYKRILIESEYYGILETIGDMQVVRMFFVQKFCKKRQKAIYSASEVMQHWVGENGKVLTLSKAVRGLCQYYDSWITDTWLEIRTESYNFKLRAEIPPYKVYPKKKILPVIRRNGFNGNLHGFAPQTLFSFILSDQLSEMLLKSGQTDLLKHHYKDRNAIPKIWNSVKICIRNNYKVKDASMWVDYLRLLEHFGRDLHNPKYVCPLNLKSAHDHLVSKKRQQDRKQRLIDLRNKITEDQKEFEKQKGRFFNLQFTDGKIVVKTLQSVEEFMNEGDVLGHCVFTNEYYKKPNSLILSARIDNTPIETIEVSLSNLSIVQSRGIGNKATKYHDRIVKLVQGNIKRQIEQIA
jgi:hypothetical protein